MKIRRIMQIKNWNNLQSVWKGDKKPDIDFETLKAEVKKRESLKRLRIVFETVIVLAVVVFTIYRLTNQPGLLDYLIMGQLWFITILALAFNVWNRSSFKKAETYSHNQYLKLLVDHSLKKRRAAIFVFILTILNLPFYTVLFLTGYISPTNTTIIASTTALFIIYIVWSVWYYQIASSNIEHYREELRKSSDQ